MLEAALAAGVAEGGGDALLGGVLPTPAASVLVRRLGLDLAAVVSASHNPWQHNGIKFFGADGRKLDDELEARIEALVADERAPRARGWGGSASLEGALDDYVRELTRAVPARPLGPAGAARLRATGRPTARRRSSSSGSAPPSRRSATSPTAATSTRAAAPPIRRRSRRRCPPSEARARVRLRRRRRPGDRGRRRRPRPRRRRADRALRRPPVEDRRAGLDGGVAVTVMSNYGFHQAMKDAGIEVATTPVGDRNVSIELEQRGWALGGEQSGHIIWTEYGPTGDGIAAALLVMSALDGAALAEAIPMRSFRRCSRTSRSRDRGAIDGATAVWEAVERESAALEGRGRVLVRPSGTEPLVRVMVEAPTGEECREVCDRLVGEPSHRGARPTAPAPGSTLTRLLCAESSDMSGAVPAAICWSPGSRSSSTAATTRRGSPCSSDGHVDTVRAVGNLANLRAAIGLDADRPVSSEGAVAVATPPATIGLAHTRWATHGRVTEENAHPHGDCTGQHPHRPQRHRREPHRAPPRALRRRRTPFSSETDAEIVAHMIEKHYDGDLTDGGAERPSPSSAATTRSWRCTPTTPTRSSPRDRSAR